MIQHLRIGNILIHVLNENIFFHSTNIIDSLLCAQTAQSIETIILRKLFKKAKALPLWAYIKM